MKHYFHLHIGIIDWLCILLCCVILSGCKTQSTILHPQSTIIRDSISVTYRQGVVISPADYADSAAMATSHASLLNASSVGEATSNKAHKMSLPRKDRVVSPRSPSITQIPVRVDTVVIEKWHTQKETEEVQVKYTPPFYKRCTWGFWILLLLLLGSIAIRILRLIYFRR